MGGWAWVSFTADVSPLNFEIDSWYNISKIEGADISNLKISGYMEWTINVDSIYENYGETTPYDKLFTKNVEINFDKDYLEEWVDVAKEVIIEEELEDYIEDYLQNKYNLVYLSRYGYLDATKYKKVEEYEKQHDTLLTNGLSYEEYKNNLDQLIEESNPNEGVLDKLYKEYDEIVKYIKKHMKFISFYGETNENNELKIDTMYWAWYVRWKLEPDEDTLAVDSDDISLSWWSQFYFELDNNDELIYSIYDKDYLGFSIYVNNMYNKLEEYEKEGKISYSVLDDIFEILIYFTMTKEFVDFYYNTFENNDDYEEDEDNDL